MKVGKWFAFRRTLLQPCLAFTISGNYCTSAAFMKTCLSSRHSSSSFIPEEDVGGVLLSSNQPIITRQLNVLSNIVKRQEIKQFFSRRRYSRRWVTITYPYPHTQLLQTQKWGTWQLTWMDSSGEQDLRCLTCMDLSVPQLLEVSEGLCKSNANRMSNSLNLAERLRWKIWQMPCSLRQMLICMEQVQFRG